jgi:hypothetical protein
MLLARNNCLQCSPAIDRTVGKKLQNAINFMSRRNPWNGSSRGAFRYPIRSFFPSFNRFYGRTGALDKSRQNGRPDYASYVSLKDSRGLDKGFIDSSCCGEIVRSEVKAEGLV